MRPQDSDVTELLRNRCTAVFGFILVKIENDIQRTPLFHDLTLNNG